MRNVRRTTPANTWKLQESVAYPVFFLIINMAKEKGARPEQYAYSGLPIQVEKECFHDLDSENLGMGVAFQRHHNTLVKTISP